MKTRIHIAAPLIAISLVAASVAFAQHSHKLGKIEFSNSCSPAVQEKLLRGIAMLHSFYYSGAQMAFKEVAAEDDSCTIAAWGYASILMLNPLQGIGSSPENAQLAHRHADRVRPDIFRVPQGGCDPRKAVREASRPPGGRALPDP